MKNEKVAKGRIIGLAGPCFYRVHPTLANPCDEYQMKQFSSIDWGKYYLKSLFQDKKDASGAVLSCGSVIFGLTIGLLGGAGLFFGLWWSLNYTLIVSAAIAAPGKALVFDSAKKIRRDHARGVLGGYNTVKKKSLSQSGWWALSCFRLLFMHDAWVCYSSRKLEQEREEP